MPYHMGKVLNSYMLMKLTTGARQLCALVVLRMQTVLSLSISLGLSVLTSPNIIIAGSLFIRKGSCPSSGRQNWQGHAPLCIIMGVYAIQRWDAKFWLHTRFVPTF
eukprot:5179992-Amphidinium_carterae.1